MDERSIAEDAERRAGQSGRPRRPGVDAQILNATLHLLAQYGYEKMSMVAVAEAAGVTRPTIYRRWETKEDLVTSAVSTLAAAELVSLPADPWERLAAELDSFFSAVSRPRGVALLGNVLALEDQRPQLIEMYRAKVVDVRRSRLRKVLESLRGEGSIRRDIDLEMVINMAIGCYYSARVSGVAMSDDWPRMCVETIRNGIDMRGDTP